MKFTYNSPHLSQIYLRDLFYSLYFAQERELRRYSPPSPAKTKAKTVTEKSTEEKAGRVRTVYSAKVKM